MLKAINIFMDEDMEDEEIEEVMPLWNKFSPSQKATLNMIAKDFTINPMKLLSETRGKKPVATARQVAMYALSACHQLSQTEIAELFSRDVSTVGSAIRKIRTIREGNQNVISGYLNRVGPKTLEEADLI